MGAAAHKKKIKKKRGAAAVQEPAAASPTVEDVGNAFVLQYYHVLHHSPEHVHRFYQEDSKMGRPSGDGAMGITTTREAIKEKILSLDYGELGAQIETVDAQESFGGGVLVLVTGYLTGKDEVTRNFTQSFFLAPQDNGYFVLNDSFRCVENVKSQEGADVPVNEIENPPTPDRNTKLEDTQTPILENPAIVEQETVDTVCEPAVSSGSLDVKKEEPVGKIVNETPKVLQSSHDSINTTKEVQKKSYASIFTGMSSDSTSHSSDKEYNYTHRGYFGVLASSGSNFSPGERSTELELPQVVLESLFKVPKSPDHDPNTMNWRNVVKKLESIGKLSEPSEVDSKEPAEGDEYQFFRKTATQHWESTRSYYQKAASAYSTGERSYAACLSDQGKLQTRIAREQDEKASQQIFKARNKNIGNVITIDLHGQHVKQAMKLLKLHLLFGAYACSIQTIRVITGSGSHGLGKSKIKQSVIGLLERENIHWTEENSGTVLIRLNGQRNFSFVDSDSESE